MKAVWFWGSLFGVKGLQLLRAVSKLMGSVAADMSREEHKGGFTIWPDCRDIVYNTPLMTHKLAMVGITFPPAPQHNDILETMAARLLAEKLDQFMVHLISMT